MRFYTLTHPLRGDADTVASKEAGYSQGDAPSCPACGKPVGMLSWLPPFRVVLTLYGKYFGDVVFFPGSDDFLVSQKFREVYHANRLAGLSGFDPVEVMRVKSRHKKRPPPPAYFRVGAGYGHTALDLTASGFEWIEPPTCTLCHTATIMRWKHLVIEEGTWTGEDIFRPRGMAGEFMVSERFKVACEQNQVTNALFTPAEEAGHDFYPGLKDPKELELPPDQ